MVGGLNHESVKKVEGTDVLDDSNKMGGDNSFLHYTPKLYINVF